MNNKTEKKENCFNCNIYPFLVGEAYCQLCQTFLQEKKQWKEKILKRDQIIKVLESRIESLDKPWIEKYWKEFLEKNTN